ncbi:MAG: 16S rRNA (guanine(527)-N(7))-methyltransferase RsmG [Clostridia bacterium]|nr:16S rRNA (guanine(527)-N(7))-methyltransferase RsmG [Clostridia bacterium]
MDFSTSKAILEYCNDNKIDITEQKANQFEVLSDMLCDFNAHTNVTALKTKKDIAIKHFVDSIAVLKYDLIKKNAFVIDIGCGAGFPGLPIKMLRDDIHITFVDSTAKKLKFTSLVAEQFGLENVKVCPNRAEELVNMGNREVYDVAVSRAVASLPVLLELVLPYVKPSGIFCAYKSSIEADRNNKESELSKSMNALKKLGAKVECVLDANLPDIDDVTQKHCIIVIKKTGKTPAGFPRRYAAIVKNPL